MKVPQKDLVDGRTDESKMGVANAAKE